MNSVYEIMIAKRLEAKAASRARSAAKSKAHKAHLKAVADFEAAQVGPFFCPVCKSNQVERFGVFCQTCHKSHKIQAADWAAAKPAIIGTF